VGTIAAMAEQAVEPKTPMEARIHRLGHYIVIAAIILFVAVLAIGWLRGIPFSEIVLVAISQMVSLVPEGLPVAMTVALAVGVQRMAARGAIVRRLAAVETLGSTTVICSDKTGTLTRNEMTVVAAALGTGRRFEVTGGGYRPDGAFLEDGRPISPSDHGDLIALLEAGVLCNDAVVTAPRAGRGDWGIAGDPTEAALITAAMKAGVAPEELRRRWPRRAEIPFDPTVKLMATLHGTAEAPRVIIKGAPEAVIAMCPTVRADGQRVELDAATRQRVNDEAQAMATRALRVLAVAEVPGADLDGLAGFGPFAGRATLLGLFGELDPPRAEVGEALAACRSAGIKPVMVTGDHPGTGLAVATMLDIVRPGDLVVEGPALDRLDGAALDGQIERVALFARVEPSQKLRIVEAYQRAGEVVAVTGDGVNDAPALARADVGVAMGASGTEVAKEAAKMVVTDDNFATIVAAVKEGRVVYRNIRKILLLFLSTAAAEVVVLVAALMAGFPPPFAAVQILWNNLVTEGLITVNLAMEPAEGDEMAHPPVARGEPLVSREMAWRIGLMTVAIAGSTLGWFIYRIETGVPFVVAQTETFTVLAVCEWFNVLNCRSATRSAFRGGLLGNRWLLGGLVVANLLQVAVVFWGPLNRLFHTTPIDLGQVVMIGLVASPVLWVEEVRKWLVTRRTHPA
jgi:Ca2+-transporting ATPase